MRRPSFRWRVGEQVTSLLRKISGFGTFWLRKSAVHDVQVDYELARELYENSNPDYNLGAGFCRRIIDATVEFVGLPRVASDDESLDDWLNDSIREWWADDLQQLLRNASRDSRAVVRIAPYDWLDDPLISASDRDRIKIDVIEPERVRIYYNPFNAEIVDLAIITHHIPIIQPNEAREEETWDDPEERIHEVREIMDRERVRYYDVTEREWLTQYEHANTWGVVPALEIYNEWDSTLARGQSDLEAAFPFIKAFHDVMRQSLEAHGYHSIPKVTFKVNDVMTFLRNNWPGSFNEAGEFSGQVSWKGKEIIFLESEEGADFLEAESILGDSKTLLEFLFDCICTASQSPAWVLMRTEQGAGGSEPGDAIAFVQRIQRKRRNWARSMQKIFKMALVMSGRRPIHVKMSWDTIRPEDETAYTQSLSQLVMALEVLAQRKIISDQTYRAAVRPFISPMKNPAQEELDAEDNFVPEIEAIGAGNPENGNVPVETRAGAGGANE